MDVFIHAAVGYGVGGVPGMLGGVLPDIAAIKRLESPTVFYRFTHSLLFVLLATAIDPALGLGVFSHLAIDQFTHGEVFAPRWFFPLFDVGVSFGPEWEFFNRTYFVGLGVSLCVYLLLIGFRL